METNDLDPVRCPSCGAELSRSDWDLELAAAAGIVLDDETGIVVCENTRGACPAAERYDAFRVDLIERGYDMPAEFELGPVIGRVTEDGEVLVVESAR